MWRKLPHFQAEKKAQNPVTSLAVMVFLVVPKKGPFQKSFENSEPERGGRK